MAGSLPRILNVISGEADALAGPLRALVTEHGAAAGEIAWLSPERAFDLPFLDHPDRVLAAARENAAGFKADINVVPAAKRRKKLLIADMESTIIDCEIIDELAEFAGCRDKIAAITERAMRGELAFEPALHERVSLLKGLPVAVLERVYHERVRLNAGARELVATMRAHGAFTMLVSGGFGFFAQLVATHCGFKDCLANELAIEDGILTGDVTEPILGREAKRSALEAKVAELKIAFVDTIAVGDGANDIGMIEAAALGVAYHAKPVLAREADAVIAHNDLTSLLYLQGYTDAETVR
jgi:phosphoserine phosphatase